MPSKNIILVLLLVLTLSILAPYLIAEENRAAEADWRSPYILSKFEEWKGKFNKKYSPHI